MEAAGLVVGVAGLTSLFASVLDAVDKWSDYKSFIAGFEALQAQLNGHRVVLQRWGRNVGLENGQLPTSRGATMNPDEAAAANRLLRTAYHVLALGESESTESAGRQGHIETSNPTGDNLPSITNPSSTSRRFKAAWALRRKTRQTDRVALFGNIVEQLTNLLPPDDPNQKRVAGGLTSIEDGLASIQKYISEMDAKEKAQVQREVNFWILGLVGPNDGYHDFIQKRLQGTCEWIFDRPLFRQWLHSDSSSTSPPLLWIHGHAGFGKTILCAHILDHLMSTDESRIAYYFFSTGLGGRDDPYFALRSWVSQLASKQTAAFDLVRGKWDSSTDQTVAPRHIITQLLKDILRVVPGCILVIDGLDEYIAGRVNDGLIARLLGDISASMSETTRTMIVSRDQPEIRRGIEDLGREHSMEIKISAHDVREDTTALSQHIIQTKLPKKSDKVKDDLSELMSNRCDGQFLWLTMQGGLLRKGMSFKDLQRVVDEVPARLDEVYDRNWAIISNLSDRDRKRAHALLRWAAFSLRPLTIGEVAEAVLLDDSYDGISLDDLPDNIDEDYIESEVIGLCGPLLEVSPQSSGKSPEQHVINLAHFTVKQYLVARIPIHNLVANANLEPVSAEDRHNISLARLCLRYIRSEDSWAQQATTQDTSLPAHFRDYAAASWHAHLQTTGIESEGSTMELVETFMCNAHPCWDHWRQWYSENVQSSDVQHYWKTNPEFLGSLYFSVHFGFTGFALRLIQSTDEHTLLDRGTAIVLASQKGNASFVEAFLEKYNISQTRDDRGRTPLYVATMAGQVEVVKLLLRNGCDASSAGLNGRSPLHAAAHMGSLEIVQHLIAAGAELSASDDEGWTPLHWACDFGHLEIARLLISDGADISLPDDEGWTPLHWASDSGHFDLVQLMLDSGANVSTFDEDGQTPLTWAASNGHLKIVRILHDAGADISAANNLGSTALHSAIVNHHLETAKFLISAGADISAADHRGSTPLHLAILNRDIEAAQLLIDAGADMSYSDGMTCTPLYSATLSGHVEGVRLLIDAGADISTGDDGGRRLLGLAASRGHFEIAKSLVDAAASTSFGVEGGFTSLHIASFRGDLEFFERLVSNGADISAVNSSGKTPLYVAALWGHTEIVQRLLHLGADFSSGSARGETPLMAAARSGSARSVERLLSHKTAASKGTLNLSVLNEPSFGNKAGIPNPQTSVMSTIANMRDNHGRTAFFQACQFGSIETVRLMIAQPNIEFTTCDYYGSTALHAAIVNGHYDIVHLLLDSKAMKIDWQHGSGRPITWWTSRSRDPRIQELLRKHAQEAKVDVHFEAASNIAFDEPCDSDNPEVTWCDACMLRAPKLPKLARYYSCDECDSGGFCLCIDCVNSGIRCRDESHPLTYRERPGSG